MGDTYRVDSINPNLEKWGYKLIREKGQGYLEDKEDSKKTPIWISTTGKINEEDIDKMINVIHEKKGGKKTEISLDITKPLNIEGLETKPFSLKRLENALSYAIVVLSIGLLTLILSKTTLTGYAINNISNTTSNIGILVCVVGILGALYYRHKCKKK